MDGPSLTPEVGVGGSHAPGCRGLLIPGLHGRGRELRVPAVPFWLLHGSAPDPEFLAPGLLQGETLLAPETPPVLPPPHPYKEASSPTGGWSLIPTKALAFSLPPFLSFVERPPDPSLVRMLHCQTWLNSASSRQPSHSTPSSALIRPSTLTALSYSFLSCLPRSRC